MSVIEDIKDAKKCEISRQPSTVVRATARYFLPEWKAHPQDPWVDQTYGPGAFLDAGPVAPCGGAVAPWGVPAVDPSAWRQTTLSNKFPEAHPPLRYCIGSDKQEGRNRR
jgi:hypothetical protein